MLMLFMNKKYLIFSPTYSETVGGVVVLHKLCSILNNLGYESYLYPSFLPYRHSKKNGIREILRYLKNKVLFITNSYKTNIDFNTPIYTGNKSKISDDFIVIYPEVVFGNPLNAKNVVRWLLHQPGFHTGEICYGKNELYFKFNSAINNFNFDGSITSKIDLKVIHYPLVYYNTNDLPDNRHGIAYCIRKGRHKKIQHDLCGSILIDGKSHREVSEIFKSVDTFISYDTYTAYSIFAVLCGCNSVVIPDDDVSKEAWYPLEIDRYGLSYGFNELDNAKKTAHLVKEHVEKEEKKSIDNVVLFVKEVEVYFE